jgi:hypothetical protein
MRPRILKTLSDHGLPRRTVLTLLVHPGKIGSKHDRPKSRL